MRSRFLAALALVFLAGLSSVRAKSSAQREVDECILVLKKGGKPEARAYAITRLGELELIKRGLAKEATPLIALALKDRAAPVRAAAARTLGILGYDPETWVKDVAALLTVKEDRNVKLAAAETLGLVGNQAAFALEALTSLRDGEAAKPDGKRDNDLLNTLNAAIEKIQAGAVTLGPWYYIGPFDNEGNAGFKKAYPPEKEIDLKKTYPGKNGATARWQLGRFTDGEVNNLALFGEKNNLAAVVYLYREITCTEAKEAAVSLGSDDTLTVWLNGEQLLAEDVHRAAAADQNKLTLKLRKGKNALLLKICQGDGDWAFYFRLAGVKGAAK